MMKTLGALVMWLLFPAGLWAEPLRIGTTFSAKQSAYLRLDWKETYHATLGLGFDLIRLGAYWDELEPREDAYHFDDLDWALREAKAKGVPIILTIGMKAPRWPEYFIPPWVLRQLRLRRGREVSQEAYLRERTLRFLQAVVSRYRDEEIIHSWQVENEPLDRAGPGYWWIGRPFLEQEIALVRALDPSHRPIVMNAATHPHRFLRFLTSFFTRHDAIAEALELCDVLALNVYPLIGHRWPWKRSYYRTRAEGRLSYLSRIMEQANDRDIPVWITELQAEPWEPGQLVYLEAAHPPTSHPEMLQPYVQEMRSLGIETILLWGVEYWYYRKTRHGDPTWWEAVGTLLQRLSASRPRASSPASPWSPTG
ncbi:MAG: beta-galactosidase [Candidatus Omnitrophota bacterium]|nr:beta-galactosidase [Candidatus Omnitrophota bacterium]